MDSSNDLTKPLEKSESVSSTGSHIQTPMKLKCRKMDPKYSLESIEEVVKMSYVSIDKTKISI